MSNDPFALARFLSAQAPVYEQARAELRNASKETHWMWFIFPQVAGLGTSAMAQRFSIGGLEEARAYLDHPVLGARLRDCVSLVNLAFPAPLARIFGYPDDLKFHSSVTLFRQVERTLAPPGEPLFAQTLKRWFDGQEDEQTLRCLARPRR